MTRGERIYARLLRAYPAPFRERYADEMLRLFREQRHDASEAGGAATARLWASVLLDLAGTAPRERWHDRGRSGRVARAAVAAPAGLTVVAGHRSPDWRALATALALSPLLFLALIVLTAPGYTEPLLERSLAIAGLPLGAVLLALVVGMSIAMAALTRRLPSRPWAVLPALAWATVACGSVILGPALALVILNAGG